MSEEIFIHLIFIEYVGNIGTMVDTGQLTPLEPVA